MNNTELELKVKEILEHENFFDMVEAVFAFEKEYKATNFYKKTKMPLINVVKESKIWYALQFKDVIKKLQTAINELDLSNINEILEQLGEVYSKENSDIMSMVKEFGTIME